MHYKWVTHFMYIVYLVGFVLLLFASIPQLARAPFDNGIALHIVTFKLDNL